MRLKIGLASLILLLISVAAQAGLRYEFTTTGSGAGTQEMSGTVYFEGDKARVEIRKGDGVVFADGSVVLSNTTSGKLVVISPSKKTYYDLDLDALFNMAGSMMNAMMKIEKPSVKVTSTGSGGTLEGYPTTRYVIDSSYTMNVNFLGRSTKTLVVMKTQTWTTDKLPSKYTSFVQTKNARTGIEELDKLLVAQTGNVKGFPLKQVTTTTNTQGTKSQTTTTTLTVSGIKQGSFPATHFVLPAGYKKEPNPIEKLMSGGQ